MREIHIPETDYTIAVASNGHLVLFLKNELVGHVQFNKKNATDNEIIEAAKYCFRIKV